MLCFFFKNRGKTRLRSQGLHGLPTRTKGLSILCFMHKLQRPRGWKEQLHQFKGKDPMQNLEEVEIVLKIKPKSVLEWRDGDEKARISVCPGLCRHFRVRVLLLFPGSGKLWGHFRSPALPGLCQASGGTIQITLRFVNNIWTCDRSLAACVYMQMCIYKYTKYLIPYTTEFI